MSSVLFISKIRNALSLDKRCDVAKIKRFTVEIATRSFESTALFKNGRIIAIDSDESWSIAIPYLVKRERELIGKKGKRSLESLSSMNQC